MKTLQSIMEGMVDEVDGMKTQQSTMKGLIDKLIG